MILNMSLSYKDSISYYNIDCSIAILSSENQPTTKSKTKVADNSFRASLLLFIV